MESYNNFMNLMSSVMDILPRFLELSEKTIRTFEEENELEKVTVEMEALKSEIIKILPDINKAMTNEFIEHYMDIKKNMDPEEFNPNIRNKKLKPISHSILDEFIKNFPT